MARIVERVVFSMLRTNALTMRALFVLALVLSVTSESAADVFKPEERVLGMLGDGSRVHADRIVNWHDSTVQPTLAGAQLFDAAKPFRWVIDQGVTLGPKPQAFIEFFGGDCLPGHIKDYEPANSNSYDNPGEFLVISPLASIDLPGKPPAGVVRINTDWVKRIVFGRRAGIPEEWRPGTAFLHDGSEVRFRAARWSKTVVSLLTEDGVRSLLFSQVAEVHFPKRNAWDVWFEQLGVLTPDLSSRLIQFESSEGLRVTTSQERFRAQFSGDKNKSENWYPLVQPAWSLDPISVPFRTIRSWRFFAADFLPLTVFEPTSVRKDPVFSSGWNWTLDRGVQGESLRNNQLLAGWGFGVHAPTQLSLPLHPIVTQIRCRVGLDQAVSRGGCAQAMLALSSAPASPFWKSGHLIGPEKTVDTGWFNVPARPDPTTELLLLADPAITDRPKGADPFDIRDCLDWMEPEWRLDRAKLLVEVQSRLGDRIPALRDWKLSQNIPVRDADEGATVEAPLPTVALTNEWDETIPTAARYLQTLQPVGKFLVAGRKLRIGRDDRWLALCISRRPGESTAATVQIRIDGKALLERSLPQRSGRTAPDPILVPVDSVQGKQVHCEVVVMPEGDKSRIEWRGAALSRYPPGIAPIFDEDPDFLKHLDAGEGEIQLATEDAQNGKVALKVTPVERSRERIPNLNLAIREHPEIGEFRFIRFAWKKQGGKSIGLQIAHDGMLGLPDVDLDLGNARAIPAAAAERQARRPRRNNPRILISSDDRGAKYAYGYDAGAGAPTEPVLRLDKKLPAEWVLNTRDIFNEFGAFDLTGLALRCPDGTAAWFDQIYVARSQNDFAWIPELVPPVKPESTDPAPERDPNVLAEAIRVRDYGHLVSIAAPGFTASVPAEPIQHLAAYNGRKNVIRTMPPAQGKPLVLRGPVSVRAGKKTMLKIGASRHAEGDWQLVVKVAAEELHRSMVDMNTAKEGWVDHEIDLSKFAGQSIVVEVHNHPNDWKYEHAFWSGIQIVEQ